MRSPSALINSSVDGSQRQARVDAYQMSTDGFDAKILSPCARVCGRTLTRADFDEAGQGSDFMSATWCVLPRIEGMMFGLDGLVKPGRILLSVNCEEGPVCSASRGWRLATTGGTRSLLRHSVGRRCPRP